MQSNTLGNNILSEESKKEVLDELELVLSSDLFSRSSVLSNFLKFIVEQTLAGQTDGLKEYTIAVSALGKPSDFNPQIDAIVRIHAGRLRRLLNEYYTDAGKENPIRIEVIKGTYVPVFRSQWIDEPGQIVADDKIQYSRSKLTLAVLPFRNLCPDDEYQFFVDGFGEELSRIFSAFQEIAVIAHHSTLKYATIHEDIRVIGAELGVHYLINGSVKRSATEIRVNVVLLETLNGRLIWSKNYSHLLEKEKIIDIQDQIIQDVNTLLSGQYGFIVHNTVSIMQYEMDLDLQTFDAILWNYRAQRTHSKNDCQQSQKALEKALQNDPNNVMCLVVLGDIYLYTYSLGYYSVDDPVNEALKLIKKAIRLAPLSQYAHLIHGWANIYLGNKKEAIEALEYSIELGPSTANFDGQLGFGLACAGEYKRAQILLHNSLDLNPHCPWWYYVGFFLVYYQSGKYKEALKYAQKINASEDVFVEPLFRAAAMGQLGLISEVKTDVRTLVEKFPEIVSNLEKHLSTFILDKSLIDEIIEGAKKAGLPVA